MGCTVQPATGKKIMSDTISKTKALRLAAKAHSQPYQHGGWKYTAPWSTKDLQGARTEISCQDYWQARQNRACSVAAVALELMGWEWYDASEIAKTLGGSARSIVEKALAMSGRAAK